MPAVGDAPIVIAGKSDRLLGPASSDRARYFVDSLPVSASEPLALIDALRFPPPVMAVRGPHTEAGCLPIAERHKQDSVSKEHLE